MALEKYKKKRKFSGTPEPKPLKKSGRGGLKFVVQKHQASHLHYDFRLENRGVLLSWAVPKGPSLNPSDKRLAMAVEDHPFDYRDFEGIIPEGNYGAGSVMVWDFGTYGAVVGPNGEEAGREQSEKLIAQGMHKGHITFNLHGKKLNGEFALVKIRGDRAGKGNSWLLFKADDDYAEKRDVTKEDLSAKSGKTMQEIAGKGGIGAKAGVKAKMPGAIKPMLASLAKEAFDDPDWLFEIKFDGFRALAEIRKKEAELYSRNNISFNKMFSPIVEQLRSLGHDALLDGEVVVLDKKGISQFQLLQNYQNTGKGALVYFVFDILYLDGYDLRGLPLTKRKEILKKLLLELNSPAIRYSDDVDAKGKAFFKLAKKQGLEGVVAKEKSSKYVERRSKQWLKIKTHMRQEAVIGGFTEPRGSRKDFGALVLGVYNDKRELIYIGHTGGGLDQNNLKKLHAMLKKIMRKTSPFRDKFKTNAPVTWVEPKHVAEISFQEWTSDGHVRQPIYEGLRVDKNPKEVKREKPI